jgi:hypothetical protein
MISQQKPIQMQLTCTYVCQGSYTFEYAKFQVFSRTFSDIFRHFPGGRRFHNLNSNVLEQRHHNNFVERNFTFI